MMFVSCAPASSSETVQQPDTTPDDSSMWEKCEGITEGEDGSLSITGDYFKEYVVKKKGSFSDEYLLSTNLTLTKYSYFSFVFEASFDGDSIKNGYEIKVDARVGVMNVNSYMDSTATELVENNFATAKDGLYKLIVKRNKNQLDVSLDYAGESEGTAAYSSIVLRKAKGTQYGVVMGGDTVVSAFKADEYNKSATSTYQNPIYPKLADPSVYYEDGKYYVFGTDRPFECFVTTDLVNYESIGKIANVDDLFGYSYYGGAAIYKFDGLYYMTYTTHTDQTLSNLCTCIATSENLTGPYTQPKQTMIDPVICTKKSAGSYFLTAPDGKIYYYWYNTESGYGNNIHGAEAVIADGVVTLKRETEKRLIVADEPWEMKNENGYGGNIVERPIAYYHDGYYYIFYAGSHWVTSYGQGYAVSDSPLGEFKKYDNNPILNSTSSLNGVGCIWITKSPDQSELIVLYHCHYSTTQYSPRSLCIDRMKFIDVKDGPDIAVILGPTATPQPYPSAKT